MTSSAEKPDKKQIMEALECCVSPITMCGECAYGVMRCMDLKKDILKLLKEQETVKPYIDIDEAKCPVCKVKLTRQELLGDDVLFEDFFDYCPHCGREVKWE